MPSERPLTTPHRLDVRPASIIALLAATFVLGTRVFAADCGCDQPVCGCEEPICGCESTVENCDTMPACDCACSTCDGPCEPSGGLLTKIRLPKSAPLFHAMDSIAGGLERVFEHKRCDSGCDMGCDCGGQDVVVHAQPVPMQLTPIPPTTLPMGSVPPAPPTVAMPSLNEPSGAMPPAKSGFPNDARQPFVDPVAPPTPDALDMPLRDPAPLNNPPAEAPPAFTPEPMPIPEPMPEPIPAPRPVEPPGSMFDRLSNPFEDDSAYQAPRRSVLPASFDRRQKSRGQENLHADEFDDYFRR
ncbi:MAG: hypothetical protein AAGD07_23070 [Planctomycetota bacterium]